MKSIRWFPLFLSQYPYDTEAQEGHREAQGVQQRLNRLGFKIPTFTVSVEVPRCGSCGWWEPLAVLGVGLDDL